MLVRLASTPPRLHEGDLVDLLLDCHRRIRRFVAIAANLADAQSPSSAEVREAAEAVRRYFTVGLPLHVRDEEDSILPRLRGRNQTIDRALKEMALEHRQHEATLTRLTDACATLGEQPDRWAAARAELAALAADLGTHFAPHLEREETVIFPGIRRLLDPAQQSAILAEFRARRLPAA